MIIENAEPMVSAMTFTTYSTNSDDTILLSEKENCTHETLYSFPSVGILLMERFRPAYTLSVG
jgi:hypothetical protein